MAMIEPMEQRRRVDAEDVLAALQTLRAADVRSMRTIPAVHGLTASDLAALRFVAECNDLEQPVGPTEIAAHLALTTSAVTSLLERLGRGRLITIEPHPTDRRRKLVRTAAASFIASMDEDVLALADGLTGRSRAIVADFLLHVAHAQNERTGRREPSRAP